MSANASLTSKGWLDSLFAIRFSWIRKDATELGGYSVINAWNFFSKRFDFLWGNFNKTTGNLFRFKILQYSVVAIRGDEARKAFFHDKNLNFTEGYKILVGSVRRNYVLGEHHLFLPFAVLPICLEDVNKRMLAWGKDGRFDPFRNINDLVFQMTVRVLTCDELATNYEDIRILQKYYWDLEKSATPTALLLPWIPSPAKKKKLAANKALYTILKNYVDKRTAAQTPSAEAIDILLEKGDNEHDIINFVLSVIFAALINTGMNVCWALVYLGCNPEWRNKVKAEIDEIISKHTDTISSEPLHKRLSGIPLAVWEDDMPIVDVVLREVIRITLNQTFFRRNMSDDIMDIGGHKIARGEFVAYSTYDAHMNPDFYENPEMFDPDRYKPGKEEDKKSTFAYVGWGVGSYPCPGMKLAKLEMKAILVLFLTGYDYSVVDSSGNYPKSLPKPNYNDIHSVRISYFYI
ncbi:cytochrome P450 [Cyathus striatus]|nr:cytochrome P450 [Cyathus striatus]